MAWVMEVTVVVIVIVLGQSDNILGRVFALHIEDLGLISGILHGP